MISHPIYVIHSFHYTYDIVPTMYDIIILCVDYTTLGICMTLFALQKTSHPLYHTKPKSLWLHIHIRHEITHTISDITPTVSLSSRPLHWYHTHFVWLHTHYICDILCTIYNIIPTSYALTLFYLTAQTWHMKPHPVCSSKHTLSLWHHSH